MDFFESQAVARKRTVLFVIFYLLATLAIIPFVYLIVLGVAMPVRAVDNFFREWYDFHDAFTPAPHPGWWDATLFAWVAGLTLLAMLGGTLYRLWQVSRGGYVVAEMLGGFRLDPATRVPEQRRLLNVVDEMAIASGLPAPDVYLLRSQRGINAFAAGFTPDDAVIGVTQGALEQLSRDELQAVVAHEFSHILHGDMRLKTILVGLLHGLVYLGFMSNQACLQAVRGEPGMVVAAFLAFVILGVVTLPLLLVLQVGIGLACAIKRMASRQREFLADAAAVQFTRNPDGVAGALKKVGGLAAGSCILSEGTGAASHFFFADALRGSILDWPWLSSHPPLAERIRRIDADFSGVFEFVSSVRVPEDEPNRVQPPAPVCHGPAEPHRVATDAVVGSIGSPGGEHLALAKALLAALPASLAEAVRTPAGARGVLYALLLNAEPEPRRKQLERLRETVDMAVLAETQKAMLVLDTVRGARRLPLATLAVRSLKALTPDEYGRFRETVGALIAADDQVDLFELALERSIRRHLAPSFGERGDAGVVRHHKLGAVIPACIDLLACLANWGSHDVLDRDQAFRKGLERLLDGTAPAPEMRVSGDGSVAALGAALDEFSHADPAIRKRVVEACVCCVTADGRTSVEEAELLQAVADSLGCPMPPVV